MTLGLIADTLDLVDFGIAPKGVNMRGLGRVYQVRMH